MTNAGKDLRVKKRILQGFSAHPSDEYKTRSVDEHPVSMSPLEYIDYAQC